MQPAQGSSDISGTHFSLKEFLEFDDAIRRGDEESLKRYVNVPQVNFSKDPLLSAMLAFGSEKDLIIRLLDETPPEHLERENDVGDTALHVAVANDQVEVATKMIEMKNNLVIKTNSSGQTPLHKSALFGQTKSFWMLIHKESDPWARTDNGSTVLHCAIVANNPELALEIAKRYERLMTTRNINALTPLQLMVTIPQGFRSGVDFGIVESLIYKCIPLIKKRTGKEGEGNINRDVERQQGNCCWEEDETDVEDVLEEQYLTKTSKKLHTYCKVFRYLRIKNIVNVAALRTGTLLICILKKLSTRVKKLEEQKNKHVQNLELVAYLARYHEYWSFMVFGMNNEDEIDSEMVEVDNDHDSDDEVETTKEEMGQQEFLNKMVDNIMVRITKHMDDKKDYKKVISGPTRWRDSPLIVGAKMGLYDFVEQILKVYPESAQYKDYEGKNVLQVAIKHGHEKIVDIIIKMATEKNPLLPSSLLSVQDKKAHNTILHYAAETTIDDELGPPMQMFYEIKQFERVEMWVPKDIRYNRNIDEKTAQELFTEKHINMVKTGRQQLMELGKTCSGLMAAVVFASSFSIPGEKDNNHNPVFIHRAAFKVFSHAYVIGLSCAACALLLFVSLLTSNYREQDFRQALPIKYSLAMMSFILSLLALLVAFTCNIYLNIYGGEKAQTKQLLSLICELTVLPVLCFVTMILGGADLGVWDFIRNLFR